LMSYVLQSFTLLVIIFIFIHLSGFIKIVNDY